MKDLENIFDRSQSVLKRKTDQFLMPAEKSLQNKDSNFDLYPSHDLGAEKIFRGYGDLVDYIATKRTVCLDGFVGVDWNLMMLKISSALESKGITFCLINISECLKPEHEILKLTKPFLGEEESVWGTKCDLELRDFFDSEKLSEFANFSDPGNSIFPGIISKLPISIYFIFCTCCRGGR